MPSLWKTASGDLLVDANGDLYYSDSCCCGTYGCTDCCSGPLDAVEASFSGIGTDCAGGNCEIFNATWCIPATSDCAGCYSTNIDYDCSSTRSTRITYDVVDIGGGECELTVSIRIAGGFTAACVGVGGAQSGVDCTKTFSTGGTCAANIDGSLSCTEFGSVTTECDFSSVTASVTSINC